MREINGDFFAHINQFDAICFTSNGVVKPNGELVMGAGIARQFRDRWPDLPKLFGRSVIMYANVPKAILYDVAANEPKYIINFPTKYHYSEHSSLSLIRNSCSRLLRLIEDNKINSVLLTRPGCGRGHLSWEKQVKPLVLEYFKDDRVTIIY